MRFYLLSNLSILNYFKFLFKFKKERISNFEIFPDVFNLLALKINTFHFYLVYFII